MDLKLLAATFSEGLLSFFSPCVMPLIPLYMSYLAGDNRTLDEEGNTRYHTGKLFLSTLFFVLGISLTFVLLAFSLSFLSVFLVKYRELISAIGGTLVIVFGLHETGLIHIDILDREIKPKLRFNLSGMHYIKAFLLGFVFSIGWSPCIGPMLSSAILLASSAENGYLYIVSYGLGLVVPFLIAGLFTNAFLNFIAKRRKFMIYVSKIAGIVLLGFGIYMISDAAKRIALAKEVSSESGKSENIADYLRDYPFEDTDGNLLSLSDYRGKYILLNFSATWCVYCDMELPDLQTFASQSDAECFVVMSPLNESGGMADIEAFVKEKQLSIPLLVDKEGILFYYLNISSYPTTYVIDPDGDFLCYANGAMSKEGFDSLLDYAHGLYEEK